MAHIFGNRSAAMFLRETMAIARLLHGLQVAYRSQISDHLTPRVLLAELESLWGTLSLYHQRRIQQQFAQDCQNLADVVSVIAAHGSGRVLSSGGLGRQLETGRRQPRTALETLRWISGYFARRHIRTTRT
jgi:hypothetical protein